MRLISLLYLSSFLLSALMIMGVTGCKKFRDPVDVDLPNGTSRQKVDSGPVTKVFALKIPVVFPFVVEPNQVKAALLDCGEASLTFSRYTQERSTTGVISFRGTSAAPNLVCSGGLKITTAVGGFESSDDSISENHVLRDGDIFQVDEKVSLTLLAADIKIKLEGSIGEPCEEGFQYNDKRGACMASEPTTASANGDLALLSQDDLAVKTPEPEAAPSVEAKPLGELVTVSEAKLVCDGVTASTDVLLEGDKLSAEFLPNTHVDNLTCLVVVYGKINEGSDRSFTSVDGLLFGSKTVRPILGKIEVEFYPTFK